MSVLFSSYPNWSLLLPALYALLFATMWYALTILLTYGLTVVLASPALTSFARSDPPASTGCGNGQSGARFVNNRACWVTCSVTRPGGNFKQAHTESVDACLQYCAADPQCYTAQYREDNGFCYLKTVRNQAVVSSTADTIDCDFDYTPHKWANVPGLDNCPLDKKYKLRTTGTMRYAITNDTYPYSEQLGFYPGLTKADGTTYRFYIDSQGACGFRPINIDPTYDAVLGFPKAGPRQIDEGGAAYLSYQPPGPYVSPMSCIITPTSRLSCHLQVNNNWNKIQFVGNGKALIVTISTQSYGVKNSNPPVLDSAEELILEEV